MKIAVLTPYTGPAAFLGQDQGSWATLAAKNIGAKLGLKIKIVAADSTLDPAVAATAAQKVIADSQVIGVVGPATSGAAAGTSPAFFAAHLAAISGSATNAALTKSVGGKPKTATPAFFRIVADDSVQGTRDAQYMVNKLGAKKVAVFDAQEPYSQGLADTVEAYLKAKGVAVQRFSVTNNTTDFSAIVNKIDKDTDVAFTPFQVASNAQAVAVTLREQGKKAVVFGTDGTIDPAFKFPGSYVSNFAPDLNLIPSKKALVDQWKKANPGRTFSPFGPTSYGATQVIMQAAKKACIAEPRPDHASGRPPSHQVREDRGLDPRRLVRVLEEDERPAERLVLALPDPVGRHGQADRQARLVRLQHLGAPARSAGASNRSAARLSDRITA